MIHKTSNHQILEQWVNSYYDDLFRWAKFKTSDTLLAEDLVQEVFLAASKGMDKFNHDSTPKTWLFQILNFKIADHFRQKGRNPIQLAASEITVLTDSFFDQEGSWNNPSIQKHWVHSLEDPDGELEGHLSNCMLSLPEDWKLLIFGKYFEGKKADQLCENHGITKSNYWQIIHRSKLFLKNCIEKMLKKI